MKANEITIYEVYCFDVENILGQKNNGHNTMTVQVLNKRPRGDSKSKSKLFGKCTYEFEVVSLETGKTFWTSPELLTPIPDTRISVCLRLPNNAPQISLDSLRDLRKAIELIKPKNPDLGKNLYLLHNQLTFYISVGAYCNDVGNLNDMLKTMTESLHFNGSNYDNSEEGEDDV